MLRLARSGLRAAVVAQSHERADVRPLYTPLTTIKPPLLLVNSPTLFFPLPFLFLERGDPWVSYPYRAARHATPSGGARTSLREFAGRLNSCIGERREEFLHYFNYY